MADAKEILEAIIRHTSVGGTLSGGSPLIAMAEQAVAAAPSIAATQVPARRYGLTDAEKAARRNTLGSSEIAAVVGVNPFASLHNVWLSKVHGVDFEGNEATELGNILEPSIFAIYAARYGRTLVKGAYTVHPSEPWASATPDAAIVGGGLVEAKLVGLRSIWMWGTGNTDEQESDAIPLHYLCQAQWQMAVTGEPFVDVSALLGTEFRTYRARSNPDVQAKLLERGRDFWERYVVTRNEPPVDGSKGAAEMLKRLYPKSGAERIEADESLDAIAESLRNAREAYESAKLEKQFRENEMKAALRDASGAYGKAWRVRYSTTKSGTRPLVFEHDMENAGGKAA